MSELNEALDQTAQTEEPPQDAPAGEVQEQPAEQVQEQQPEQTETAAEQTEQPKHVPLPELLAERRARQQAQRAYEELQQKYQTVDERLNKINERLSPPPSVEDDPFGALAHRQEQTQEQLQKVMEQLENANKQSHAQSLRQHVEGLENQFKAQTPDYDQAVQFLKSKRLGDYEIMGLDPATMEQTFNQEVNWVIQNSLQAGKNPAEAAYEMARRSGWKANGAAANVETPGQKRLKDIAQKSQQQTLSAATGGAAKDKLTVEDLADMSDEELDATLDKMDERAWKSLWT